MTYLVNCYCRNCREYRNQVTDADIELACRELRNPGKSSSGRILPEPALTPTGPPGMEPPSCATCGLADSMPDRARPGALCTYCAEMLDLWRQVPGKPARKLPDYMAPPFWQWLCAWTGLLLLVLILTGTI